MLNIREQDEEPEEVEIVLIPLRAGSLPVPVITVRPSLYDTTSDNASLANEVHQVNAAQRVEVIQEHRRTTFWVPLAAPPSQSVAG